MKPNFGKKLHKNDRLYGTSTVGARGQVVIPADARKDFKLASGDQLIILGNRLTKTMVIMKSSNLGEFVKIVLVSIIPGLYCPTPVRLSCIEIMYPNMHLLERASY